MRDSNTYIHCKKNSGLEKFYDVIYKLHNNIKKKVTSHLENAALLSVNQSSNVRTGRPNKTDIHGDGAT